MALNNTKMTSSEIRHLANIVAKRVVEELKKDGSFDTDVIGIDEVAKILGMSKQSVYNRIEDIPHTKFGKKLRFFKSDIVKMLRR